MRARVDRALPTPRWNEIGDSYFRDIGAASAEEGVSGREFFVEQGVVVAEPVWDGRAAGKVGKGDGGVAAG